jgi:uncharacterized protein (TIGR03083 family)
MTTDVRSLAADLEAEQHALCSVVSALADEQWELLTPSPGWTVADQIGHLTYFDAAATTAIEAPDEFARLREELFAAALDRPGAADELTLGRFRAMDPPTLHEAWRDGRRRLGAAAATLTDGVRVELYGPSMSA